MSPQVAIAAASWPEQPSATENASPVPFPAAVTSASTGPKSRKQACQACRQRKKRCDGAVPACTTCSKWNVKCIYASSDEHQTGLRNHRADALLSPTPTDGVGLYYPQAPTPSLDYDIYMDQTTWDASDRYIAPPLVDVSESEGPTATPTVSSEASISLPPDSEVQEMVDSFFDNYFHLLPCISQKRFRESTDLSDQDSNSPLVWAICAVVCTAGSEATSRSRQSLYLDKAKRLLEEDMVLKVQPLRSLQAAIWIIFCLFVNVRFYDALIYLGKAYRHACYHGFHQIDCQRRTYLHDAFATSDAVEKEERRKVMWTLYLLDRQANCLTGAPMVIDDRYFVVDFPIDDQFFQNAAEVDAPNAPREPFTRNLKILTANNPLSSISANIMRLIYKSTVLLGHITDYHNANLHHSSTTEAKTAGFRELENALTRFWLRMPVSTIYDVPAHDLGRFVWLMFNLHKCSILLHHSTPAEASDPSAGPDPSGFLRGWGSVQTVMRVINQIAPLSVSSLLNPFLGPLYFLCGRFLAIRWIETQLPCHRDDLDLVLTVLGKMGETWGPLADKWKRNIELDLAKGKREVQAMKMGVGNYMEPTCYT